MTAPTTPNASNSLATEFPIRETKLLVELGLSRDGIRLRRQHFLTQGQHWDYVNKRVQFSAIGAEILRATKKTPLPAVSPSTSPGGSTVHPKALLCYKNPAPVPFTGELLAWHCPSKNERLLIAYIPGTDPNNPLNLVNVLVRSNKNFLRGMKLTSVRHVEDNRYELVGPCPRMRGRW